MRQAEQRLLVIGLDVGDGRLIREWSQRGHLPVFTALIQGGTWGTLQTTADTLHVSAWPSIYTGTQPGKHGVYYTVQPAPGLQSVRHFGPDQYGQPPVWQILSDAGKRCIVFDAPYTHPARHFTGVQIFEWGTWAWYWHPMSIPAGIMRRMTSQCGTYPVGFEANQVGLAGLDRVSLRQRLIEAVKIKAKAVCWLMAERPWDLFWVVFGETHPAAHYFWPPATADAPSGMADAPSIFLREIYEAIDQAVGEIIAAVSEDTTVCIISGDGVGPNYTGWHLLPEVLQRLGLTAVAPPRYGAASASQHQSPSRRDLLKILRDLAPPHLRRALSHYLPRRWRQALMARWTTANIDWSQTRAFCLPTDLEGCIRLNVRGREPQGIVRAGGEYEALCEHLISSLGELINPATGRPAVRQVIRSDEALPGERRHYLPDLVVLWSQDAEIQAVQSPRLGIVKAPSPDVRLGTHRAPGFVIARGPAVRRGHILPNGHIVDFAPTVLAGFGLPPHKHMDGHRWSDLWTA